MKQKLLNLFRLRAFALIAILCAGVSAAWGEDQTWTHEFASPEAIQNNAITVNGVTWNITTTEGAGEPTITSATYSKIYGLKFGSSKSVYFGSVTFTTDYFNSYNVKSVKINVLNNGSKEGTLTAQQGSTTIGTTSASFGTTWTDLTVNTTSGTGGELSFTYSVQQAFYIHSITVVYDDGGTTPDTREEVTLSFPQESYTADYAEGFTAPTLTISPVVSPITFESSKTDVATVDEDGVVTLVAAGTTIITASFAGDDDYKPANASYTLTVTKQAVVEDGFFNFEAKSLDYGSGVTTTSDNETFITEDKTWTADNVTLVTSGKYRWWDKDGTLRFYNNTPPSAMTISVPTGYVITKIEITGGQAFNANVGSYSSGTWTGQSQEVVLTYAANSGSVNVKTVKVTYEAGTSKLDPALVWSAATATATLGEAFVAPTLSKAEGFEGTITYTSSKEEVATIDATGAITLVGTGSTVIKASFAGDDNWNPSSATYTLNVVALQTIAEARAQETGNVKTIGVVTSCVGKNAYIQDATAAILVYGSANFTDLAIGDEIVVEGTLSTYKGLMEITNPTYTKKSEGNTVTPEVMTIEQVNASEKQGWLVKIENATVTAISGQDVTIAQGTNTVAVRFNSTGEITFAVNALITLTGNIGCFNTIQIANPRDVTIIPTVSVTMNTYGYATLYYSDKAFIVPEGVTATTYNESVEVSTTYEAGDVIPANEAVVLQGSANTEVSFVVTATTDEPDANNALKGLDEDGETVGEGKFYMLSAKNGKVGFYWGKTGGEAFTTAAHKAYLVIPASKAKEAYYLNDEVTGIQKIDNTWFSTDKVYNLNGQCVDKNYKGVVIVNGKKMINK